MQIAVVVPAFDIAPFVGAALCSMLAQTHTDWSLVVIDDGSTDGTAAVASGFTDPRIRLIRQDNAGVSTARNRGIAAFLGPLQSSWPCLSGPPIAAPAWTGDTDPPNREDDQRRRSAHAPGGTSPDAFVFLDGDDWLAPDALARLAETLEAAPWAVAACGRYARVATNDATRPPRSWLAASPPKGRLLERLLTRNLFANGGHLLIRREAIEVTGPFRQDLSYGEDWEYWTRVALLGEFVAVRTRTPLLFVRERPGGAYLSNGSDPSAYRPTMDAIYANPAIADRLGAARVACLWHAAEAEMAWAVGRELIRHGNRRVGRIWLRRSVGQAPSLRRLALMGLSWLRSGPFRPYRAAE